MADLVYGFVEFCRSKDWLMLRREANRVGINILEPSQEEVSNWLLPTPSSPLSVFFELADPGSVEAVSLVDGMNYAPEADIRLPLSWRERFSLLVDWIESVFATGEAQRMWIALSDGFEHERTTRLKLEEARAQLFQDMEEYAPPNILYCIEP